MSIKMIYKMSFREYLDILVDTYCNALEDDKVSIDSIINIHHDITMLDLVINNRIDIDDPRCETLRLFMNEMDSSY